jgi:hypothetical protein
MNQRDNLVSTEHVFKPFYITPSRSHVKYAQSLTGLQQHIYPCILLSNNLDRQ